VHNNNNSNGYKLCTWEESLKYLSISLMQLILTGNFDSDSDLRTLIMYHILKHSL